MHVLAPPTQEVGEVGNFKCSKQDGAIEYPLKLILARYACLKEKMNCTLFSDPKT